MLNSTFEAITTPSIALSGFIGTIIFAFISAQAKIKKNPLRFFVSLEESQFMSSSMKFFRSIYLGIFILFFSAMYSIFIGYLLFSTKDNFLYSLFNFIFTNPKILAIVIILFFCIMQVLCMNNIQKRITTYMYNKKRTRKTRQVFILVALIFIFIYLILYSIIYGSFVSGLLVEQANLLNIPFENLIDILLSISLLENSIIITLVIITVIYALLLFRVKKLFMYLGHSKIAINIVLKNGVTFLNKQLLHIDIDNSYLISDTMSVFDPTKHLIPKNNIEYLSFSNIYCSLGLDIPQNEGKIITEEDFTNDEFALFRSMMRKEKQKREHT